MMTARQAREQAGECMHLSNQAPLATEARALKNISQSWTRLAGQLDRYETLLRESALLRREAS